jgi:hypothetical protein
VEKFIELIQIILKCLRIFLTEKKDGSEMYLKINLFGNTLNIKFLSLTNMIYMFYIPLVGA